MMTMDTPALHHDSSPAWRPALAERSDEQLMLAYQQGDTGAFETLLTRHEKGVYGFALRMLGDGMLAEEVAQESFLRVIQSASRYRAKASFRNYLYRIARNLCVDLLRKRPREPRTPDLDAGSPGTPEGVPNGNPGPEHNVGAAQLQVRDPRGPRHPSGGPEGGLPAQGGQGHETPGCGRHHRYKPEYRQESSPLCPGSTP